MSDQPGEHPARTGALGAALEREHREIDAGIEAFLAGQAGGQPRTEPLRQAIGALRRHIFLEEEFLFPPLRGAGLVAPIFVMLREHGEIWDTLDALDAQLAINPGAAAMSEICRTLLEQLERHNAKEELIVYPQADAVLTAAASARLSSFLATGQMPEGWVCQRAGAAPAGGGPS
jgi:regulator of cell morphogenesis and NO signaling